MVSTEAMDVAQSTQVNDRLVTPRRTWAWKAAVSARMGLCQRRRVIR
jgi:hypothetical protein